MFPQVKPKQKAVDDISSAQVTKSFRRRVNNFCFCNSEAIKNEEWLGEIMAPSLSQHPPPRTEHVCTACGLNPQPSVEAPEWQRVPSGHGRKPPTSSTSGGPGPSLIDPLPVVTACPTPDPQAPKVDSALSPTPRHPLSAKPCAELWGDGDKQEIVPAPRN